LIQKIYEVDPLVCPMCCGNMKAIAFMEKPDVIKNSKTPASFVKILEFE
jgi:hypothetical protein